MKLRSLVEIVALVVFVSRTVIIRLGCVVNLAEVAMPFSAVV